MATFVRYLVLGSVFLTSGSLAKPIEDQTPQGLTRSTVADEPVIAIGPEDAADGNYSSGRSRSQRSPQFGFESDYNDFEGRQARHLKHKHKPKPHKPIAAHGCRTFHGCGVEWQQPQGGHGYHETNHGGNHGSFASASAGSVGGDHHGTHSAANAQSASFSFGPYTATFSAAQAHSGAGGGQGGFGGFDY